MHNILIYGLLCIKCVKNTKGANLQLFVNFWAVANTGRIHGRVFCPCTVYSARVQTAAHQKMHQNSFFGVATLAIKAITLIHIQMLNYNTCNSHFKHSKQLQMVTTFVTIDVFSHHIHNSCKYQHA